MDDFRTGILAEGEPDRLIDEVLLASDNVLRAWWHIKSLPNRSTPCPSHGNDVAECRLLAATAMHLFLDRLGEAWAPLGLVPQE